MRQQILKQQRPRQQFRYQMLERGRVSTVKQWSKKEQNEKAVGRNAAGLRDNTRGSNADKPMEVIVLNANLVGKSHLLLKVLVDVMNTHQ